MKMKRRHGLFLYEGNKLFSMTPLFPFLSAIQITKNARQAKGKKHSLAHWLTCTFPCLILLFFLVVREAWRQNGQLTWFFQ